MSAASLSRSQCATPTSDQTLALLSLPISQLKRFASLTSQQQEQLLAQSSQRASTPSASSSLSRKQSRPVSAANSASSSARRRSDGSGSKGLLDTPRAAAAVVSFTAPTSPAAHELGGLTPPLAVASTFYYQREDDAAANQLLLLEPKQSTAAVSRDALSEKSGLSSASSSASPSSQHQTDNAWVASYSFQPAHAPPSPPLSPRCLPDVELEPDAASSSVSSLLSGDTKTVAGDAAEEGDEASSSSLITYVSRLSIDCAADSVSGSGSASPSAAAQPLFSPVNHNKFGLKLSLCPSLCVESASEAASPSSSSSSSYAAPESPVGIVTFSSAHPLPFVQELKAVTADQQQRGRHRKSRHSYELTEGGTLLAGGYEINSVGIMRTPALRSSISSQSQLMEQMSPLGPKPPSDSSPSVSPLLAGAAASPASSSSPNLSPSPSSSSSSSSSVSLGTELRLCDLVRLGELGSGASGTVVKALHLPSLRLVALKTISVFDKQDRHQLVKELDGFCAASGPHLLSLVGACFSEGSCTMALELMNRGSLEQLVKRYGRVRDERFLQSLLRQLLSGLRDLHRLHCVHRDIKLANMLMSSDGVVRISDFGCSRQLDGTQDMCNTFLGTMAFLSPERITGDAYTTKSDVWSVGISILYLVKGQLSLPTEYWSLLSIVSQAAPSLTADDGASPLLCDLVSKCLQKEPADRWSAEQLLSHPFLLSDSLPADPLHPPWPVSEPVEPDAAELDTIVEAVLAAYYPHTGSDAFSNGETDQQRWEMLARQLGCSKSTVETAFLRRLSPSAAEAEAALSPSLSGSFSYLPQSVQHSRLPSVTVLTMADCAAAEGRTAGGASGSCAAGAGTGRSISYTASALSQTLGSALSMSHRIREQMRIDEETAAAAAEADGYDNDTSPTAKQ